MSMPNASTPAGPAKWTPSTTSATMSTPVEWAPPAPVGHFGQHPLQGHLPEQPSRAHWLVSGRGDLLDPVCGARPRTGDRYLASPEGDNPVIAPMTQSNLPSNSWVHQPRVEAVASHRVGDTQLVNWPFSAPWAPRRLGLGMLAP
jgi:hypothetical protein